MEYVIHLAILICIYAILAQSFNVCFGLGRLLNLAHIASYSLGAYATALLSTSGLEWSVLPCLAASMTVSAFFALLIGGISLKLQGDYFAIGTLAFAAIVNALLINWKSLTRGVLGAVLPVKQLVVVTVAAPLIQHAPQPPRPMHEPATT